MLGDFSRESLAIEAAFSISGEEVTRVFDHIAFGRRYPEAIVIDNGPELTSRTLDVRACRHGVRLYLIQPGKPNQNAFIQSFNQTFRDECLNENWFLDIQDARRAVEEF